MPKMDFNGEDYNAMPICDMCCSPQVTWRYPVRTFISAQGGDLACQSNGDWLVCSPCHVLIETNDREGLRTRSADHFVMEHPEAIADLRWVRDEMRRLHAKFFEHRCGEPESLIVTKETT